MAEGESVNRSSGAGELMLVRGLMVLLVLGLFIAGTHVTYHAEVFRGVVFAVIAAVLVAVALAAPMLRGRSFGASRVVWLGVALVGWSLVAQRIGPHPGYLGDYQVAKLAMLGLLVLVVAARPDAISPAFIAKCLAVAILLLGGFAIVGWLAGWQVRNVRFTQPLTLVFINQNVLGAAIVPATVLLAGLSSLRSVGRRWRWVCVLAVVVGTVLAIGTQSRIAIGATLAGGTMVTLIFLRVALRRPWWQAAVGAMAFIAVIIAGAKFATTERFERKVAAMITQAGYHAPMRPHYYRLTLDAAADSPRLLVAGVGFSSFGRVLHTVPATSGRVHGDRPLTLYLHCEYLEWLHDAGAIGLGLFLSVIGAAAFVAIRRLRQRGGDGDDRLIAGAMVATIAAWLVLGLVTVGTRYVGAQAMLALVVGLAWRGGGVRLSSRVVAFGLLAVAAASVYVHVGYFMSDRHLLAAHDALGRGEAIRSESQLRQAISAADASLAWRSNNVHAAYRGLLAGVRLGDLDTATGYYDRLATHAPRFFDSEPAYALALAEAGRYGDAARTLMAYRPLAPNDYKSLISLPVYALLAGDGQMLNRSLLQLLADAINHVNLRDQRSHRADIITADGQTALRIKPDGGDRQFTVTQDQAAGVILGRTPATSDEARSLVATGVNRFLAEYLGVTKPLLPLGPPGADE